MHKVYHYPERNNEDMRASGVLLPITSLPSPYGIGCFSKEAYEFVDNLVAAGQTYWQILPLGPTGYGDSPYQSCSTFAGNPYFIDLVTLKEQGLLTEEECTLCEPQKDARYVDYEQIYKVRFQVLHMAFERANPKDNHEFRQFCEQHAVWLDDYALYMVVKNQFEGKSWCQWEDDIRMRQAEAMNAYLEQYQEEFLFYQYIQYEFSQQWYDLKTYANKKGIRIIGDLPIYVALDSADSWAHPELFQFDEQRRPLAVAGCPPDGFTATGQLWGNPLYQWEYHKETNYRWWIERITYCRIFYDVIRIDHFRGFDEYYSIPYGHETAEYGQWEKGPGYDLFEQMKKVLGEIPIIAEDLGFLTDSVMQLVTDSGYPGMKVLQFAFDSRDSDTYLPHTYEHNCVVYTGTHDNNTTKGWYRGFHQYGREFLRDYLGKEKEDENTIVWDMIRMAQASVAHTCIIPMQDYLELGEEARMNEPSTIGLNWKWRLLQGEFPQELVERMREMTTLYHRRP
ncbi:MAG: 4-alpha-glucanotransferase [Lachnospiraceae bacterium]